MDVRELRAFARVYESGSLTQAAQETFVTRQAMGKTIAQLEGELGQLFVRSARGVAPTELAHEIYPHVLACLGEYDRIWRVAKRRASRGPDPLRVGLEAGAAITLPVGLLQAFDEAHPSLRVASSVLTPDAIVDALLSDRVDAALACPRQADGVTFRPVYANPMTVVFRADAFPLRDELRIGRTRGGATELRAEFLAGKTVFGISPTNHVERQLEPYLRHLGLDTRISFERSDIALTRDAVASGLGGAIVENGSVRRAFDTPAYVHVPLRGRGAPVWEVGVLFATRGHATDVAATLAAFALDYVERALSERDGDAAKASPSSRATTRR